MSQFSDYLETALLNATLRNTAYTSPATVYLGLFTTSPTDANTGTEVTGNAYARQSVAFAVPSGGSTSNSALVTFPVATPATWGTVTHFGIYDAATGGNLMYWNSLTASKTVAADDQITFAAGALVVTHQ